MTCWPWWHRWSKWGGLTQRFGVEWKHCVRCGIAKQRMMKRKEFVKDERRIELGVYFELAIAAAIAGTVAMFIASCTTCPVAPGPIPEPPPVDGKIRVLQPIEQIAHVSESDWSRKSTRQIPPGATSIAVINVGDRGCEPMTVLPASAKVSVIAPYESTRGSHKNAKLGSYFEWLRAVDSDTCKLSRFRLVEWIPSAEGAQQIGFADDKITVATKFIPAPKPMPFYLGVHNSYLWLGHCSGYCPKEALLGNAYSKAVAAYGLTPINSTVIPPPVVSGKLDLDHGGDWSYRKMVLPHQGDRIWVPHAPIEWASTKRIAYYKALEKTIAVEGWKKRAWVYLFDEPTDFVAVEIEAAFVKLHAPSVQVMVTTAARPPLFSVDIFAPVYGQSHGDGYGGKERWTYVSCWPSCGHNRAWTDAPDGPGFDNDAAFADLLIDRPWSTIFEWFRLARERGDQGMLYYSAVEGFQLVPKGIDLALDAWNFGGQGDGLLFLPGKNDQPIPSMRLVALRAAVQGLK